MNTPTLSPLAAAIKRAQRQLERAALKGEAQGGHVVSAVSVSPSDPRLLLEAATVSTPAPQVTP